MRIGRLELVRFGKFTDHRLDLPRTTPDLQLIVGQNEAGKSTLRAALADLLFGIEVRSPFDFLHPYRDMCLAATVEQDGERLAFRRRKRSRDSLSDADDRPLVDDRLAAFLGPVDRALFERMFALDRRRLEEGGIEILKAKNDLGRMLFEASAGLAGLGEVRRELDDEADQLWGPRKKQTRAYTVAAEAFEAAGRVLREATVRAGDWQKARKTADEAAAALAAAVEHHGVLEKARVRLDRVRRVAPQLRARQELVRKRTEMGEVVALPVDAAAVLKAAEVKLAAQATVINQQEALVAKAEADRQRIVVDQSVLGRREAIVRLEEERHRVRDHPLGIEKRQAELQQLRDTVAGLVRELGWPPTSEEEVAGRLPSRQLRAGIQDLLKRHAGLVEAERLSAEAVDGARRELATLERELVASPDRPVPVDLQTARDEARRLGDVAARSGELAGNAEAARRRLATAMTALAPWTGDLPTLRGLCLPEPDALQAHLQATGEIADRLRTLRARTRDLAQELETRRLSEAQIQRDRQPITGAAIAAARADRDALWRTIREARLDPTAAAPEYESKVAHADDLADRRYLAAADTEKLEHERARIEHAELTLRQYQGEQEGAQEEQEQLNQRWRNQLPNQLAGLAATALNGWLQRRRQALENAEQLADAEAASASFEVRVTSAREALAAALMAVDVAPSADLALPGVLAAADAFITRADGEAAKRQEQTRQREKLASQLDDLVTRAAVAAAAMADWRRQWADRLAAVHLAPDFGTAEVAAALELHSDLAKKLDEIDDLKRNRLATMRRDLDHYAASATALVAEIAPELMGQEPDAVARALAHRLNEAEKAKERLERAVAERAEALKVIAEAEAAQQQAAATLQPLADRAGTSSIDDLRAAIARSEQASMLDAGIGTATQQILESGDGLSLADLEQEVAAEDLAAIVARLSEIDEQREAARHEREQALLAKKAADDALAAIDGSAAAAEAEARRQEALADMASATERYITVFVAGKVLGWAIDRFRADRQDPLLRRAGDIFRGLTLGSFAALTVDYEGDTPQLMGRRDSGAHVGVDGMSEGTRDQLYLALRLAAIELHLDKGRPLPFIADDLFVNFDDARAAAGFQALADLARRTQVIFLSHHAHLVDVARQALGDGLMVSAL